MLSAESLKKVDAAVAKYPNDQKQSALMAALALAQDEEGHLSPEMMGFVAGYLGMAQGKRVRNGRVPPIPDSDQTTGHDTAGQEEFWKQELAEVLRTAPRQER